MRILIVTSAHIPPKEGIGNHVTGLQENLIKKGHEAKIASIHNYNKFQKFKSFYQIRKLLPGPLGHLFSQPKLKEVIEDYHPDIIHYHSPLVNPLDFENQVCTIHTPMYTDTKYLKLVDIKSFLSKLLGKTLSFYLEKKLLSHSLMVSCVSKGVSYELSKFYQVKINKINYIPNAIDFEKVEAKLAKAIPTEEYDIFFIGRHDYRKGIELIIEVAKKWSNLKIGIAGKGPLTTKIIENKKKYNLKNLHLLGFIGEIEKFSYMVSSKIGIIPSTYEGMPTTLIEMMFVGLPVIASRISGIIDLISNGENGLLFEPDNLSDLLYKIEILINDQNLRKNFSENARNSIQNYNWINIVEKYINFYLKALDL